jgi:3-phenylpropionate/trans-cinnamate dioxygenase ferredoxin subunit
VNVKPVISITALDDGKMKACKVDDVDVLLCRVDGQFYAVANRCSHARQALDAGRLRGHEIICPLHSARFDIRDGRCLAAPATQPIQTFPVTIEGGKVMVSVEGAQQPPRPRFGPLN